MSTVYLFIQEKRIFLWAILNFESNGSLKTITIANLLIAYPVLGAILQQFNELSPGVTPTVQIRELDHTRVKRNSLKLPQTVSNGTQLDFRQTSG